MWLLLLVLINPLGDGKDHARQLDPTSGYLTKEECVQAAISRAKEIEAFYGDKPIPPMGLACYNPTQKKV
jgi:hypothetical protein